MNCVKPRIGEVNRRKTAQEKIDLTSPQAPVRAYELPSNRPDFALSELLANES
jgi:hypothetical protein